MITCKCGDLEHIKILGDKAIIYKSKEELLQIFKSIRGTIQSHTDWNAHKLYTPEFVMNIFKRYIFDMGV